MNNSSFDKPKHHCGVAGYHSKKDENIPQKLFFCLYALQHRGQEGAGISYGKVDRIVTYKGLGLVSDVLKHYLKEDHPSRTGIGHVRYSTHGGNRIENVHPFHISCNKGEIAIAHNGNISNIQVIKDRLVAEGSIFQSSSDTELILHLIARSRKLDFLDALVETLSQLKGAFSIVMLHNKDLIAFRDPKGFRPLYLGWKDDVHVVVSETCAFDIHGITEYREIEPGEIVVINDQGVQSIKYAQGVQKSHCVFEFIYFARPDSQIFGHSVYETRKEIGRSLARTDKIKADFVMAVPDSGNSAALGYAQEAGIPFEMGLTRNHFAGRSFTLPSQAQRELAVKIKLNPIREQVQGKVIILIDDSLVRGTTSKYIVKLLRDAGAKEIHLRLSAPEIKFPCFYGIDVPTRQELISNFKDPKSLAQFLGADSVGFLPMDNLRSCVTKGSDYCYACFSGEYPEELPLESLKQTQLPDVSNG